MKIPIGEWLPDQPDLMNPGATTAKNCYPVKDSYKALSDLTVYSSALTERPLASFSAKDTSQNTHLFAGTASALHKLGTDGTFSDVSIAGGYTNSESWEFALYGDRVIAASAATNLQSYVIGASSLFANLIADLKASHIAASEEFVMVGNTYDTTDGDVPYRVRWCAIGDPTDWTVSAATQSDYQDLNSEYGPVTGIVHAGDFYVFQEKAISRLHYVGSPEIFEVDTFETDRGTKYPGSIANIGNMTFYLAQDGFYLLNYSESIPIGADKVNKYFFSNFNDNYSDRIRTDIDPINNLVIWAYPSTTGGGSLDRLIIYNWVNNKWSESDYYTLSHFGNAASLGYTLEDLDSLYSSVDAMTVSLDSRVWKGGELTLAGFNASYQLCWFTGDPIAATVETTEVQPSKGRSFIKRVKPLTDATVTVNVGTRDKQSDSVTWSSSYSENVDDVPVLENAIYHRFRMTTSGSFDHIQGIEILEMTEKSIR